MTLRESVPLFLCSALLFVGFILSRTLLCEVAKWPRAPNHPCCLSTSLENVFLSFQSLLGLHWLIGLLLDQSLLAGAGHRRATPNHISTLSQVDSVLLEGKGAGLQAGRWSSHGPCEMSFLLVNVYFLLFQQLAPYLHFRLKFTSSEKRALTTSQKGSSTSVFLTHHLISFIPYFFFLFYCLSLFPCPCPSPSSPPLSLLK